MEEQPFEGAAVRGDVRDLGPPAKPFYLQSTVKSPHAEFLLLIKFCHMPRTVVLVFLITHSYQKRKSIGIYSPICTYVVIMCIV